MSIKESKDEIKVLKDELKAGKYRKLYVFYGGEDYLKKDYILKIEKGILNENSKALNRIVVEGKFDAEKVADYCNTQPIFSEKKLVIVNASGIFKAKKKSEESSESKKTGSGRSKAGSKKKKTNDESLLDFFNTIPEHTCLIFYEEEVDKRLSLVKQIEKYGLLVNFSYQKPDVLAKWAVMEFKKRNKNIDNLLASKLIENCDQGMNEIYNEIEKVVTYVGDRSQILPQDIEAICVKSIKVKIFDLTDAISEKNSSLALKLLDDMVTLREPIQLILFMIARQFRNILQIKLLTSGGIDSSTAAKKLGMHPFVASQALKQGKRFSVDELKNALNKCLEMDVAIKSGKIKENIAAELLIAEISSN